MEKNFIEIYNEIEKGKKLNFLKQLLLKDSDMQQQFIAFTLNKQSSLDSITAVNIEELRDELWNELSEIDVNEKVGGCYYDHDGDDEMANELFKEVFTPFVDKVTSFIHKGNYLDAFRSMLAIYELKLIEAPYIEDDEYYVFGEDVEYHIRNFVSSSIAKINLEMQQKVISTQTIDSLITIFFERVLKYRDSSDEDEYDYDISHFNHFFEYTISEPQNAETLLKKIRKFKIDDSVDSANIVLHCADITGDDELYLKVANEFFMNDKQVALKLQKRYKKHNMESELARVSQMLFEKEDNADYALFVIENIDKEVYEGLYISALRIYIKTKHTLGHYMILREYLDEHERLNFIEDVGYRRNTLFYIQLLEIENQYKAILNFVTKNSDSYDLAEIIKPILSIYPDEVFDIIRARSGKMVEGKGRSSYARACRLLQLMLNVPQKKEALKSYIDELYNYQPRLPALRDELKKAGLL